MSEDDAILQQALRLYQQGSYQESEAAFERIRRSPEAGFRALAGLGMVRIAQNRTSEAVALFDASLRQKLNADAFYGLGHISEVAGDTARATSLYARALQQDPSHTAANRRLDVIAQEPRSIPPQNVRQAEAQWSSPPPQPQAGWSPPPPPPQGAGSWQPPTAEYRQPAGSAPRQPAPVSKGYSDYAYSGPEVPAFYAMLASDVDSELSQRTLQLLRQLSYENRRPRLSAYPGLVLAFPLLLAALFGCAAAKGVGLLAAPFLLVLFLIVFVKLVNIRRTRYTIKDGWIKIDRGHGFLQKTDKTEEVTHLLDSELKQGLVETLTNNAVLVLNFGDHLGKMHFRGLAPRGKLKILRQDLNNLSRMLRSNPLFRGIIA